MAKDVGHEITELLWAWRQGDEQALEELTPHVYRELHRAAKLCTKDERDGHILQTTALINELYLRLTDLKVIDWQNRAHFFALCARQMRRILTDQARARHSHKRGGGAQPISLDAAPTVSLQSQWNHSQRSQCNPRRCRHRCLCARRSSPDRVRPAYHFLAQEPAHGFSLMSIRCWKRQLPCLVGSELTCW
jgi:hypothetical protein